MKKIFLAFLLSLFIIVLKAQNTEIKIKFRTFKNQDIYLGFHYGNNKYIRDTTHVDNKGIAVFTDKNKDLKGGIYLIITPDMNYFEFILAEKKIFLETDTGDFIKQMKVIESEENKIFFNYLLYIEQKQQEKQNILKEKAIFADNKQKSDEYDKKVSQVDEDVKNYMKSLIEKYPDKFFPKVLKMMNDPVPREKLNNEADSTYSEYLYNFYQQHYFDNVDFSDEKILRTPIYESKIDRFMDRMTIHHPDSIKLSASRVIDLSRANEEVFKFTLVKLFNKYAQSEYMGMDAVYVYLAERYYLSGLAKWADSAQIKKIYDRVVKLSSNLIGMKAPELIMKDTNDQYHSLHAQPGIYTILVFWDPSCGHCQKAIPFLEKYWERVSHDSFSIYSVNIGNDGKEWKQFIADNKLSFLCVWDPLNYNNFRVLYDIFSSPVVYLLDKNKKIVAKRIGVDKIEEIVNILEGRTIPEKNDLQDSKKEND
ncbi:MAG TPA: redoxin domain-containing protein [Bacteroidia bacterium]|nr:redoxin domain-containing protein [Bacteroidia bacterium]HRS57881.1 redoxin domain-containing protein [Bacteroidia bacterium]